jgi:hypothetical protein
MDLQTMITELNEKLAPSGGSMQTKPDKYPPGHYLIFTATEGDEDENDPTTKIIDIEDIDEIINWDFNFESMGHVTKVVLTNGREFHLTGEVFLIEMK